MTQEEIRQIIRDELQELLASDRYIFHKLIQILDGRNIQLGRTTGTKIGLPSSERISLHGATPTIQASKINDPSTAGGTYNQAQVQSIVDACIAIIDALEGKGLSALS